MRIYLLCPMCPVSYNYIYFFEGVFKFTDATFMSMHESTLLSNFLFLIRMEVLLPVVPG